MLTHIVDAQLRAYVSFIRSRPQTEHFLIKSLRLFQAEEEKCFGKLDSSAKFTSAQIFLIQFEQNKHDG